MIEIYAENIWYKKRKRVKPKRFFALFLFFTIITSIFLYYRYVITEQIILICSDYTYSFATESVNRAVLDSMDDKVKYSNLVIVEKNNSGDIVMMSTDSLKVNTISREVAEKTQALLEKKLNKGIEIPLMAFSGINLISGYGKLIKFKALSVSDVICEFTSTFKSVGVNQTLHSIYIDVICQTDIEIPLNRRTENCVTSVLVCESVLIGKVPEVYLNGNLFDK